MCFGVIPSGTIKSGRHPIWGWFSFKWWFVQKLVLLVPMQALHGTAFLNLYMKMLGVNMGSNVYLGYMEWWVSD